MRAPPPDDAVREAAFGALDALHPGGTVGGALGVAVSGGGDSVALMLLAREWTARRGLALAVASVDHGLRATAAAEAAAVVRRAQALGARAVALRWRGWRGRGNLQAAARDARTELLGAWAREQGLVAVALGHTLDDQAETLLMRLARGSGVDGLAAMAPASRRAGVLWLRPLLGLRRAALRDWLSAQGEGWVEDPANDDARFARVQARRALAALAPLGLDAAMLATTAARMAQARRALELQTLALARDAATCGTLGEQRLSRRALADAPLEIALRLVAAALRAAGADPARPRLRALGPLVAAACGADALAARTLHGCIAWSQGDALVIAREPAAALRAGPPVDGLWDRRWRVRVAGPGATSGEVRALGSDGEATLARARAGGWRPLAAWARAPRVARLAAPALWRDGALVCAPLAGFGEGLQAAAEPGACVEMAIVGLM